MRCGARRSRRPGDKLADLITTLKQGDLALAGSNLTVDQWFAQWRDTYKAPSGLTPKKFRPL